ncbi:hypothetical protein RND71_021232 [Anisodus tanguticus]|uniref:Uncharacterized protein n=1 Tax=Anisodus tanguticus TaxID=243964 RepID=A0AAE1V741_9SOLA|nr:hypothetical protein RND71_021232 [Anisodus tanguticus]
MGDIVDHEEEFLSLTLAIVTNSSYCERKNINKKIKKRKRRRELAFINTWDLNESCEGKIFSLLELRESVLKIDVKNKKCVVEDGKGLHLIHSLLISATSIDENSMDLAIENLHELYQNVSLVGDSVQRVAAYFADGLIARLLTRKSPFYDMIMKPPTQEEEFLAFTEFYKVSPFYQFAHFTANQAILEAFEKELEYNNNGFLHVIDFDISYGFQWPSLIQSLSENVTTSNRISLKITGYGKTIDELRETETRLVSFAKGSRNLSFEFQGVLSGSKLSNLTKRKNETLAVNLIFHLNSLSTYSKISETLKDAHDLCPSIVTIVEQEGCKSPQNFLPRFMESLHYFAAMFDSLDDCLPIDSIERLSIEKNHLGKEIKNVLNYDHKEGGNNNIYSPSRYEQMETWKGRMESHGFLGTPLSCKNIMQAKLLLKIRSHYNPPIQIDGGNGGFRVFEIEDPGAISLAWQDRSIVTASAWHCV